MKISVVTVCYNSATTIEYTLDSFFRQNYPDRELLVIDGGSTDRTLEIVKSFGSDRVRLVSEPDEGLYDAMNKGLSSFGGDAVGFLNSDDKYADQHALEAIADGLAKADIVHGDLDFVDNHIDSQIVRQWRGSPHRRGAFQRGWMPAHPTFYAHRRVVEATGRFDIALRICADYDYMLRAIELHGFSSLHMSRVLVQMMAGGHSNSGIPAYIRSNLEALISRRRWLRAGYVDYALLAKPGRKILQFKLGVPGKSRARPVRQSKA